MKGGAVHVLRGLGIVQDRKRIIRPVAVVVVDDDLRVKLRRGERRAEAELDERGLLRGGHEHARVVAGMQRLILDRNGVDPKAFGFHGLDVFHQILRVGAVELRLQTAATGVVGGLHPGGRGPGRAHELEVGTDREDFFEHGDDIGAVGAKVEFLHLRIGLAGRQVIVGKDALVQIRGPDAQPQIARADVRAIRGEQLAQPCRPRRDEKQPE